MNGGSGNDTYIIDQLGDAVIEAFNQGTDTVLSSLGYNLNSNIENLILTGPPISTAPAIH
ncbi:MAG: hypothetical protein ICV76_06290 [Nitrospiraceae bacterium]|nr:hypothetical protein [Nitrospiraceae bacterium]